MTRALQSPLVCTCLAVSEADIADAIEAGADSVAAVGDRCEAGTGCQTCHPVIRLMLEEHARGELRRGRAPRSLKQLRLFGEPSSRRQPEYVVAGSHHKKPKN